MVIIEISGGLGNQMFQYALYLKLKKLGKEVHLDTSAYYKKNYVRALELGVFGVTLPEPMSTSQYIITNFRKKLQRKIPVYEDKIGVYQPKIYDMDNVILRGYWQNELYFKDIKEDILKTFSFLEEMKRKDIAEINDKNEFYVGKMKEEISVSVHIRRGDYLDKKFFDVYGDICTLEYYRKAISYIQSKFNELHFYFFSDDIEWLKENLNQLVFNDAKADLQQKYQITIVDINHGEQSYMDMYLMSKCKHHIIANSTFSWWGAWLGMNSDKIVVAPSRWFNNHETTDIICKEWVKIDV